MWVKKSFLRRVTPRISSRLRSSSSIESNELMFDEALNERDNIEEEFRISEGMKFICSMFFVNLNLDQFCY